MEALEPINVYPVVLPNSVKTIWKIVGTAKKNYEITEEDERSMGIERDEHGYCVARTTDENFAIKLGTLFHNNCINSQIFGNEVKGCLNYKFSREPVANVENKYLIEMVDYIDGRLTIKRQNFIIPPIFPRVKILSTDVKVFARADDDGWYKNTEAEPLFVSKLSIKNHEILLAATDVSH